MRKAVLLTLSLLAGHAIGSRSCPLTTHGHDPIDLRDLYTSAVSLVTSSEENTWNRFYNYLVGNSVLILAWATLYVQREARIVPGLIVMALLCLLGLTMGELWRRLGSRGRKFQTAFVDIAARIENESTAWESRVKKCAPDWLSQRVREPVNTQFSIRGPLSFAREYRDTAGAPWATSTSGMTWVPVLFIVLYAAMLYATLHLAGVTPDFLRSLWPLSAP